LQKAHKFAEAIVSDKPDDAWLIQAYSIVEDAADIQAAVVELRNFLRVDHVVYHTSKYGSSPSADPIIRLTYPASWIAQYLRKGYGSIDPVLREGFQRTLPFDWNDIEPRTAAESEFMADAAAHGVGPHGYSIPVLSKHRHRGLFTFSASGSKEDWTGYLANYSGKIIQVANRLHRRVVIEQFGEDQPRLTARELECLRWVALGKDTTEIAVILNISIHTARDYLKSVHYKLDCVTSAQAVTKAVKLGLLVL
jgi:LuxR family transcriptional regulator, quorum-sensing system regulator CinR